MSWRIWQQNKSSIKFSDLATTFKFEFECYNPYNFLPAAIIKVRYSLLFDPTRLNYSLKKEIFLADNQTEILSSAVAQQTLTAAKEEEELKQKIIYSKIVIKNADAIKLKIFSNLREVTEYFTQISVDKIVFSIFNGANHIDLTNEIR